MQSVSNLSVLIVEANSGMRSQLRNMLSLCGITNVSLAVTGGAAVRKLREANFDIILCEYHLGEGQDGQHLLEDLRQHHLMPLSTVFIMLTGESVYANVVSAAELAPNDYILKPFSSDTLLERLLRASQKRDAFLPTFRLIEAGNTLKAIEVCHQSEKDFPQYLIDFLRLRAEMQVTAGQAAAAQEIYKGVLESRPLPWAKLGLAKTMYLLKDYAEAEKILQSLVKENNLYMDAYDWLARTQEAMGKLSETLAVLKTAVGVSPHTMRRLRKLGEVSTDLGDMETAAKTMSEVVRKGKYSDFRDPEDHVLLVKALLGTGDVEAANQTLRDLERNMEGLPKTALCKALSDAMVATQGGDVARASSALDEVRKHSDPSLGVSLSIKKDLARVCLENKREDQAAEVIMDVMRHSADDVEVDRMKKILSELGRPELGESLAALIRVEVRDLMAEGAKLAEAGDFDGSIRQMVQAVSKMPGNTNVLFNAALAFLKHIENRGWNQKLANSARDYIDRVRRQDPGHPKIASMVSYFDMLMKKYAVRSDQPS